jgi:hypothetical protein
MIENYIPKDLEECFIELEKSLIDEDYLAIKNGKEEDMVSYHHSLGRDLRNEWGLWKGDSDLCKWFNEKGIHHPDDMSAIILDSFWRHINNELIELEEQIKEYQDYWKEANKKDE